MIQSCVYKNLKESTKKPIKTNMSFARLQDTRSIYKNQLNLYTVAMNKPKINSYIL